MKKLLLLFSFLVCAITVSAQVDDLRYFDEIFDEVSIEQNVEYGLNITVLTTATVGFPTEKELITDIYHPTADTDGLRPVVLVAHTGSFLPPIDAELNSVNGTTSGTKTDSATVEMCKRLAQRGFVALAYTHRLGWNPLAETMEERTNLLINAAYRGVQDTHTLLRWIQKSVAEDGNPYRFDPERVSMMGQGTGGYIAYAVSTLDDIDEIFIDKFTTLDADGNPVPYVFPQVSGNWDGKGYPMPADTNFVEAVPGVFLPLNYPNHIDYDGKIDFAMAYGGALASTEWIDENSPPVAALHTPNDPNAPFYTDILIVPTTGEGVVEVSGAGDAIPAFNESGANDVLNTVEYKDAYSEAARAANVGVVGAEGQEHIFSLKNSSSVPESAPWEWWSPDFWNMVPAVNQDGEQVGTIHEVQLAAQPNMGPEKGRAYIDTVLNFFCPRAAVAMDLPELSDYIAAGIEDLPQLNVTISPNPVQSEITINAPSGDAIDRVEMYDVSGRLVRSVNELNSEFVRIDRNDMDSGVYIVLVYAGEKVARQKLLFR